MQIKDDSLISTLDIAILIDNKELIEECFRYLDKISWNFLKNIYINVNTILTMTLDTLEFILLGHNKRRDENGKLIHYLSDIEVMALICWYFKGNQMFEDSKTIYSFAAKFIEFDKKQFKEYISII